MTDERPATPPPELRSLLMAFVVSRALQVAAELGIADALVAAPKDLDTLARDVGADADTLNRLLRLLASFKIFEQLPDGHFANTPNSERLRGDVPGSLRGLARMYGDSALWQAWAGLEHSVRSGDSSFDHIHGVPTFEYLAKHPQTARRFDEGMVASSRLMNEALLEAYDWNRFAVLVDVAGGLGGTLAAILRANPRMDGVLFDLPHVIERSSDFLTQQEVSSRCRTEAGSFFDRVPEGADAYFMKHILHDWDDENCLRILGCCRAAMRDDAVLLVCEKLVPPGDAPSISKVMDMVMLALTYGGRERTEQEFHALFTRANLRLKRVVPTKADNVILEVTR